MKRIIFSLLVFIFALPVVAQNGVKGTVIDAVTEEPIPLVQVRVLETSVTTETDGNGAFMLAGDIPAGEQILVLFKEGYTSRRFPVVFNGEILDFDVVALEVDPNAEQAEIGLITLTDNQLSSEDDDLGNVNISGLLSASRDVFLSAAAFDFSAAFFRPRGLDNANGKVLINGLEMNKQFNNRPQWSNWGGINDVQRNQEFSMGLSPSEYTFGGLAGSTNLVLRASQYRKGGRISYASANRSYTGRAMASYSSGLMANGWAYTVLASRRYGDEGYIDGTLYDANSFFAAVEKKFNDKHSLNLTAMYTPNRRGRSTAITEEVYNLKGRKYNPFWGTQDGEIRNSRVREIEEPIFMLNHYWNISENTSINTNVGYQFGKIRNSRIDNNGTRLVTDSQGQEFYVGGASNPTPEYYQNLPSYLLRFDNPSALDYQSAFLAQERFVNDGQLDWNTLIQRNAVARSTGGNSIYALQNDVIEDKQLMANIIVNSKINDNITINGNINYRGLNSENYAEVQDLLGGSGYLDIDNFAQADETAAGDLVVGDAAQSDVRNRNRIVGVGDRYKYNYEVDANVISSFVQGQFTYNKFDFYAGASFTNTSYQRNGLYENGNFRGDLSFGKSDKVDFSDLGLKAGLTYKITGRHLIDINAGSYAQAPGIRSVFTNARQNNNITRDVESEDITSLDVSYIFRSPFVKARLTGFYAGFKNGTDVGFYFTQDLAGLGEANSDAFVQEVTQNIERRNIGVEFGIEAQILPTLKLKAAGSFGQYTFQNNPDLYLTSDSFDGELSFGDGTTALENLHVAGGPEVAYQVGFEYRDPDYWWVGATTNFFANTYIDASGLARSANFTTDVDGVTYADYDADVARDLLKQEQFDNYALVNIVGGKSWRIGDYFVGFFATINNVLDTEYRTGGFEQSRTAKFRTLQEDTSRENGALFGPRYFYGNGTSYYLNAYVRF